MIRLALAALLVATSAAAQEVPGLYDVTGVAADDVLNIRANPRASADKLGALGPGATGVEVTGLSESGDWGQLNIDEGSGWVRMSYLAPQPAPAGTDLDRPLNCFGTEPFWGMAFDGAGGAVLREMDDPEARYTLSESIPASGRRGMSAVLGSSAADGSEITAIVERRACNDGMSDRAYGLDLSLILRAGDGSTRLLHGCCSLIPAE